MTAQTTGAARAAPSCNSLHRPAGPCHSRGKRAAPGSTGPGLQHPGAFSTARRSASVAARSSSNGRGNGGGLLDWLQVGKMYVARVFAPEEEAAAPAPQQAQQAQAAAPLPPPPAQQQAQQEHTTRVQHATTAPPEQQLWRQQLPSQEQPQPQAQLHSMNGASGAAASTAGTAGASAGPIKASASTLLAGVPLQEMRERQQAAQQLQRLQEQHLGGGRGASGPGSAPTPTATPSSGSLWGSTAAPAPSSPSGSAAPQAPAGSEAAANDNEGSGSANSSLRAELSPVTSPEAAVAFAAYERAVSARRMVPVRLVLQLQAAEGQRVKVVGGHKSLGKWAVDAALEMRNVEGDTWEGTVKLPAGSITEYKYAVVDEAGKPVALQPGNNGVLAVGFADERLEVMDSWGGDAAGVSVVVDGDRAAWPATRESRLVAWANDLFQQVANLRQDLRKSRMELVGAQEETRDARLEAQRLLDELQDMKQALAEAEAERAVDRAELAHTKAVNRALQSQLEDTTASLQEAIETAAELLASREEEEEVEEAASSAPLRK